MAAGYDTARGGVAYRFTGSAWTGAFLASTTDNVGLTAIDCAPVPGDLWLDPSAAQLRELPEDTPLNGGAVGATALRCAMSTASIGTVGFALIQHLNWNLLGACMDHCTDREIRLREHMKAAIKRNRNAWPTGYVADVIIEKQPQDGSFLMEVTGVGDVYLSLDTGGYPVEVLSGILQARA